jgi:hypothetical protein
MLWWIPEKTGGIKADPPKPKPAPAWVNGMVTSTNPQGVLNQHGSKDPLIAIAPPPLPSPSKANVPDPLVASSLTARMGGTRSGSTSTRRSVAEKIPAERLEIDEPVTPAEPAPLQGTLNVANV